MAGRKKPTFDQESAFKSIIGASQNGNDLTPQVQESDSNIINTEIKKEKHGKGRPKTLSETKKRVTLALYPSTYSDLQKIAYVQRLSISEIVSNLVMSYINENAEKLEEYKLIKKESQI